MSNAESLKAAIESLKDMQGGLGQLSEMMESTQQVSDGLLSSFKDFATAGSSSSLWNAVSRFSSGIFPGFWSIQNKIRSVAVYMQYVEKKQKEQIKKEAEIAKTINAQTKARMNGAKTLAILNKDNLTTLDYIQLAEDDYFKSLSARLGKEKAKIEYAKQFNAQMSESISMEVQLAHKVAENVEKNMRYQQAYKNIGKANHKNLTEILYFNEKTNETEKDRLDLEKQRQKLKDKDTRPLTAAGNPNKNFKNRGPTAEDQDEIVKLTEAINKLTVEEEASRKASEHVSRRSGVIIKKGRYGTSADQIEGEEDKEASEGESLKETIKKRFIGKFEKIVKVIRAIGVSWAIMKKKGVMKSLGGFLKQGYKVVLLDIFNHYGNGFLLQTYLVTL